MAKNNVVWDRLDEEAALEGNAIMNAPRTEHKGKKTMTRRNQEARCLAIQTNRVLRDIVIVSE